MMKQKTNADKLKTIMGLIYFGLIFFLTELIITIFLPVGWNFEIFGLLLFLLTTIIWLIERKTHRVFDKVLFTILEFSLSLILNDVSRLMDVMGL
jgi:hypothetical protein